MDAEQQFLNFVSQIAVMKPATVKPDNANGLAKLETLMDSDEYVAELKEDGCHYINFGGRFFSTEGVEKTHNYPHLRDFFISLGMPNIILDGEIYYPGKTSQYCVQVTGSSPDRAVSLQEEIGPIHFYIWDILRTPKGTWLINEPLWKRRQILEEFYARFVKGTDMEQYVRLSTHIKEGKREYFNDVIAQGLEGCVLKRLDSIYVMGKKPAWQWVKLKQQDTSDLFITGYEPPKILYTGKNLEAWPYWDTIDGELKPVTKPYAMGWIGAIELSAYVNGQAQKICTVSGITEELKQQIKATPEQFLNRVVKISFMEKTTDGYPRHPRFEMFHEGKRAIECEWEF